MVSGATGWGFPKYYAVTIPYMSILIGFTLSKKFKNIDFLNKTTVSIIILTSLIIILNLFLLLGDPIIPQLIGTTQTISFIEAIESIALILGLYVVMPIILSIGIFYILPKNKKIIGTLFYLTLIIFFYVNIIQVTADYSTHYLYGDSETGLKQTIEFLKTNNASPENFAAYSHVGYYFDKENMDKFIEITRIKSSDIEFKKWAIDNEKLIYIIIYEKDIETMGSKLDYFNLEKKFDTYYIYKKTK